MPNRNDAQLEYTTKRLLADRPLEHGKHTDLAQNAHQNQVVEETFNFNVGASTNTSINHSFANLYSTVVGDAAFVGTDPLSAAAEISTYSTDANGNYDGITVHCNNTTAGTLEYRARIVGVPL